MFHFVIRLYSYYMSRCSTISCCSDTTTQFIQKVGIIISAVIAQHCTAMLQFYVLHSKSLYLLTPWSMVLPVKLTGSQLVKKFPTFHGTWRFINALTSARHLSLPLDSKIIREYQISLKPVQREQNCSLQMDWHTDMMKLTLWSLTTHIWVVPHR